MPGLLLIVVLCLDVPARAAADHGRAGSRLARRLGRLRRGRSVR